MGVTFGTAGSCSWYGLCSVPPAVAPGTGYVRYRRQLLVRVTFGGSNMSMDYWYGLCSVS